MLGRKFGFHIAKFRKSLKFQFPFFLTLSDIGLAVRGMNIVDKVGVSCDYQVSVSDSGRALQECPLSTWGKGPQASHLQPRTLI